MPLPKSSSVVFLVYLLMSFSLRSTAAEAIGQKAAAPKGEKVKSIVLFLSWDNVFKGRMEPEIDPARVSAEGWKSIAGLEKSWNRKFPTNRLGTKMFLAPRNIHISAEKARKEPMHLQADRPWEKELDGLSITVLPEAGRLRCWYGVVLPDQAQEVNFQQQRAVETGGRAFCYAESTDGFTWTKPNLGVCSFNGSTENNIVSFSTVYSSLFHDRQGSAGEQYKGFEFGRLPPQELARNKAGDFNSYCLYALVSPDGYHWHSLTNNPLIRHFCDTQNIGAWDPVLKKYVGFFRDHQGGRAISRSETGDFHSWPPPQPIIEPGPEDGPGDDFYNNAYTTYPGDPSLRLLFPSVFHNATDRVDVRLAISREGRAFGWVSHQPIVELGKPGESDGGQIYLSPNLIRLPDGRLAMAYQATPLTHNEVLFQGFYKSNAVHFSYGWAIWDDGRLAGIESDTEGEFYTHPLRPEGEHLEMNARTAPGGSVKVELCADGVPLEGYSLADNIPFAGDQIWAPLRWAEHPDISGLKGKKMQLHFVLSNAKIFGYRVAAMTAAKK